MLPTATARGKDLGILNIANSAPQVLGPRRAQELELGPLGRGEPGRRAAPERLVQDAVVEHEPGELGARAPLQEAEVVGRRGDGRAG